MDVNEIKKLIQLMEAANLVELEYEEGGKHVRLRRAEDRHSGTPVVHAVMPAPVAAPAAAPTPAAAPASAARRADNLVEFKSPLVGTFYRSPRPDSDAFVNVGDEVHAEKVL